MPMITNVVTVVITMPMTTKIARVVTSDKGNSGIFKLSETLIKFRNKKCFMTTFTKPVSQPSQSSSHSG